MLIEFNGYNDKPVLIQSNRIAAIYADSVLGPEFTKIAVCVGECSEEWKVHENVKSVRIKVDNVD